MSLMNVGRDTTKLRKKMPTQKLKMATFLVNFFKNPVYEVKFH